MGGVSPKRLVAEKIVVTFALAMIGAALVVVGYVEESLPVMLAGLVVVALAPFISLAVIIARASKLKGKSKSQREA